MGSLRTSETKQYHFCVPSVYFLVNRHYVIFSISTSRSPVMLCFKILMFLSLQNDFPWLSRIFTPKTFVGSYSEVRMHFKNGAPTQALRKVRILTKFDLCYTMRENVKMRKMQISFISISIGQVMKHFR